MFDENTDEVDPAEEASKVEAEERRIAEKESKKSETPKGPLKKTASGTGRGLSLAGNRNKK